MPCPCQSWRVAGFTHRFPNHYPTSGRSLYGGVARDLRGLVTNLLFLLLTAGAERRGSTVPTLRLRRGLSVGYKLINGHFPSGHHSCVLIDLGFYWLDYLGGGVRHFNKHVDFAALRYMLR